MGYIIENGTLFIDAGEPYLEHHGVLGMKWGKHLRAGKGPADAPASSGGGGGGAPEEDEETKKKIEEAAKKAGMTADEYRKKFADKVAEIKKAAYNAAGGKYKNYEAGMNKVARQQTAEAQQYKERANKLRAESAAENRKAKKLLVSGDGHGYLNAAENAKSLKSSAKEAERHSKANLEIREDAIKQASEYQAKYEKSLAGKYDKFKADRARKKSIKQRQSVERALANGPVEAKPKKSLGKRLEEKLGIEHEKTRGKKQSKEAKRIEDMYKDAARKDKAFSGTSPKAKRKVATAGRKANGKLPQSVLNPKHTVTTGKTGYSYLRQEKDKKPTPGNTPIPSPKQYTHENRPRGREKYYKLTSGRTPKGVHKRKRTAKHSDDTNAIYTEGTRLVINSKWG